MTTPLRVSVPVRLGPQEAIDLSLELAACEASIVILDFGKTKWLEPFAMLYVAGAVARVRDAKGVRIVIQNYAHLDYAKHMGFFSACGANVGKRVGAAKGSDTYLPISELKFHEASEIGASRFAPIQERIEDQAKKLTRVLLKDEASTDLMEVVTYSITELGRNVYEHSEATSLFYVAQFWPAKALVEICIADHGCGIHQSISSNSFLVPKNNFDSLNMALLPGISGKGNVTKSRNYGYWDNSGFGLFMIASLCSRGGNLFLVSGGDGLFIDGTKRWRVKTDMRGTAVRIQIKTDNIANLNEMLTEFLRAGEATAREITGLSEVTASTASAMVRRHFTETK